MAKNRKAVIIGINNYKDPGIPKLSGAVNDAAEMYKRLKEFGDFEIIDDHYLTEEKANSVSIRKAISDLLWKADPCELALFYFSGHGFQDGYGNGYIAPNDMSKDEPFVSGINMQELKQIVLKSLNKQCVLVILDCCYSGIPTLGEKAIPEIDASLDPYFSDFNKEMEGEGKIIFASSGEDQKSRENDLILINGVNTCHGIFTYHLIEGLDGKAADKAGNITLDRLRSYVEDQFIEKKQKPRFYASNSSQLDQVRIAVASKIYKEFIENELKSADDFIKEDDFSSLIKAIEAVQKVLDNNSENVEAVQLRDNIDNTLKNYRQKANTWVYDNELEIRPKISKVFKELENVVSLLSFQGIVGLERRRKLLLTYLCDVSSGNIPNERFIEKCGVLGNPANMPGQTLNSPGRNS